MIFAFALRRTHARNCLVNHDGTHLKVVVVVAWRYRRCHHVRREAETRLLATIALASCVVKVRWWGQAARHATGVCVYDRRRRRTGDPRPGVGPGRRRETSAITGGRIAELSSVSRWGGLTATDRRATASVVAPGFIDVHAHGQTAETYRFQSLDAA